MTESDVLDNNIESLWPDIEQLCNDYINTLPLPEMVYKSAGFSGLLEYINRNCVRYLIKKIPSKVNGSFSYDFNVLDDIFNYIYKPLCFMYGITPTINQFAVFCRISRENLTDIKNGVYRGDGQKANCEKTHIVKNWFNACESATLGKALNENSIGAIFVSKAIYGITDQQPMQLELVNNTQHDSAEQIAARHASAELPEKPQLDGI